eukprot:g361.t1
MTKFLRRGNMKRAQGILDQMVKKGIEPIESSYSVLIEGYSTRGKMNKVSELLKKIESSKEEVTVRPLSAAINGCAERGNLKQAELLFNRLKDEYGLTPDLYAYNSMLNVCAGARNLDRAKEVIEEMTSSGLTYDRVTLNTMINVYAECCNTDNAVEYLEVCKNLVEENKEVTAAITYSVLVKLCVRGGLYKEAFGFLEETKERGFRPVAGAYTTMASGLLRESRLTNEEINDLLVKLIDEVKSGSGNPSTRTFHSLISVALKLEDLNKVNSIYKLMNELDYRKTAITYTIMLKSYEKLGDPTDGDEYLNPLMKLIEESEEKGIKLEPVGYTYALNACAKTKNLEEALKIWEKSKKGKLRTTYTNYEAMIDVYLALDKVDDAFDLIDELKAVKFKPMISTYKKFVTYFVDKNDVDGAKKIQDKMETLGVVADDFIIGQFEKLKTE